MRFAKNIDPGSNPNGDSPGMGYFRMRRILAIQRFAAADPLTNLFPLRAEPREVARRETERVRDEPLVRLRLRPPFEDFERVAPNSICAACVC